MIQIDQIYFAYGKKLSPIAEVRYKALDIKDESLGSLFEKFHSEMHNIDTMILSALKASFEVFRIFSIYYVGTNFVYNNCDNVALLIKSRGARPRGVKIPDLRTRSEIDRIRSRALTKDGSGYNQSRLKQARCQF